MTHPSKQNQLVAPNQAHAEQTAHAQPVISRLALSGVELSAEHFFGVEGGEERQIGKTLEGVDGDSDVDTALRNDLEKMRTVEAVDTRSLARVEMTDSTFVDFTALEHYSPKMAPSNQTYEVPSNLEDLLADSELGNDTYTNTIAQEGWQAELRTLLTDYLAQDPAGKQLAEGLKIRSLSHLTPEQAVKLSAAFVQNVSKYSRVDVNSQGKTRADQSSTPELLKEGILKRHDPEWSGNGVCRNVASNVKAVFESLKQTQAELSMLNNTYSVYGAGLDGAGYEDSRQDPNTTKLEGGDGHAWNTFVTIDSKGSAVATIIDATWALDKDASSALEHIDHTEVRAAAQIAQLFKKSEAKTEAFHGVSRYFEKLIDKSSVNRRLTQSARDSMREYATTQFLRAASLLPEIPEGAKLPDAVMGGAYRMRNKLEPEEVTALFELDRSGGSLEHERLKTVIADYDGKRRVPLPAWKSAENLVFADDELQALAYEAVGDKRVRQLAERSDEFRMRLSEIRQETVSPSEAVSAKTR